MERWVGRVALVTGASAGIGAVTAKLLVKHGMKVVGCARNVDKMQEACDDSEIKSYPGELVAMKCDVSKDDEVVNMFGEIEKRFGGVDVCVNNAGCGVYGNILESPTDVWQKMVDVNIVGLSICTREAVKSMRSRGVDDGHIINVSSLAAHIPPVGINKFYFATKHAVRALSEGVRKELRAMRSHIRLSQVSPGFVETEFAYRASGDAEFAKKLYETQEKCLRPEDVADCIIYSLGAPPHVEIHDIIVRPVTQE